jgi:thiol:disulfide interchange protein DsbA
MMDRRKFLGSGLGAAAALGLSGSLQAKVVAGKEYMVLSPVQATEVGAGKIEVLEFFWYGCPHCHELEPHLNKWTKKLPKDAEFRRLPAVFRTSWEPGARAFYALEALGELERFHGPLFEAIHVDRVVQNPGDEKAMTDWLVKKGVDAKKYADALNSFSVQTKVKRAQQIVQGYRIQGVPAMAIDGRYLTSVSLAGSHDAMFAALDELILLARSERAKK